MAAMRSRRLTAGLVALGAVWLALGIASAKNTKAELQKDLDDFLIEGDWNYDDIPGALRRAKREGKPVLAVFR